MGKKIAIDINDVIRDFSHQFNVCYQRFVDDNFELDDKDITSFDYQDVFPFDSMDDYYEFRYTDYPYELYARSEIVDEKIKGVLNDWIMNVLTDMDDDKIPTVMYVSALEMGLTIQATLAFLAANNTRVREYYFPTDSSTIWDRCDILVTANPNLIANVPEGKHVIKINMPYNKDVEAETSFDSLLDMIHDENETIMKFIEE